jgi:uncharacterized protein (TIGR02266 family)
VRYKSATVDEFIENHSHDISRGGIFIKTRAPFPAGTLLKFEVRIAEDQRLMQGVGRVVWRREPERAEDGFPAGMGIKFIKTGEGAAELISQIVAAREGEESSFDAGSRDNAEMLPASGPVAPVAGVDSAHPDTPSLQVESEPTSLPAADGELRVSSPPKKRAPNPETRKVVLQGGAFDAPSSDKTPISTQARGVTAQIAGGERAPSRPAPGKRDRGSIVDETTAPRARPSQDARPSGQQQGNPSVYGLVAILGVVAVALLVVKLVRGPEPSEPEGAPPPIANTAPPVPAALPAPEPPAAPTPPEPPPAPEAAAEPAAAPTAAVPAEPAPAAGAAAGAAAAAPSPAPSAAGGAAAKPAAPAPSVPPTAAAPAPATPAKPVAPAPVPAAPAPAKPPAAAAPAPAPEKPKVTKPPAPTGSEPSVSIRPAAPEPQPTTPSGAPSEAEPRPGEPVKKRPPAAAAPAEPTPAPAPKPAEPSPKPTAPSDDNPY